MAHSPEFRDFVLSCLHDLQNDEYGYISRSDYDENIEDKWIAGGYEIFGRYAYGAVRRDPMEKQEMPGSFIKIRCCHGNTYILYDSEPDWLIKKADKQIAKNTHSSRSSVYRRWVGVRSS